MWSFIAIAATVFSAPKFSDVPATHWAAKSVDTVTSAKLMSGYPDGTFKGEKPVTRFEFAVALDRFVRDVEKGLKEAPKSPQGKGAAVGVPVDHWAYKSLAHLFLIGYLPADSPIFSKQTTTLNPVQVGKALGQIAIRLADLHSEPNEPKD